MQTVINNIFKKLNDKQHQSLEKLRNYYLDYAEISNLQKEYALTKIKYYLKALVDSGIITEEEAVSLSLWSTLTVEEMYE